MRCDWSLLSHTDRFMEFRQVQDLPRPANGNAGRALFLAILGWVALWPNDKVGCKMNSRPVVLPSAQDGPTGCPSGAP
ncbi:hypothetical protein VTN96DRAFT_782 [Rasamsonia emersonii]